MRIEISDAEINERLRLNRERLHEPYYGIDEVFSPDSYDWYGDKEGRALLSFVSHYKCDGYVFDCMKKMLVEYPRHANEYLYLGPVYTDCIREQQLSGHSWLLRGLCEYYEAFREDVVLTVITMIVDNLFLPTAGKYSTYPIDRSGLDSGGVSGSEIGTIGQWQLSSDIGCAFMSIDGLSHAYKILGDEKIHDLLDEMIEVYLGIDKVALKVQTHCTLSAARGMMRMYECTGDEKYLSGSKRIYELYVRGGGMTYTYQNLNWWGRPDSWTEPCAIVDSIMLSVMLYRATGDDAYRRMAARMYHNGLASAQRDNGGAGTDTLMCEGSGLDTLHSLMYEAFFCCTMRLSEGLWFIRENRELLYAETSGELVRDEHGVYSDGDMVYAERTEAPDTQTEGKREADGRTLYPLLKYYKLQKTELEAVRQRIIFK